MLTGRQTLGTIEQSLEDLRREEAELSKRIERSTRALTDLQERQSEAYRDLARFRLDSDAAGTLNTRLDSAAREARRLLDKRSADYKVLTEQLRQCESERFQLQKKRTELDSARNAAETRMDELMEAVDARLEEDAAYLAQRKATQEAEATAEAAATKAGIAEEDRRQKGKAYDADPLFVYLWQRGFGTPDYRRRGLVRSLDRWVAGLIGYHDARANYAMLTGIPERMARHAEHCAEVARQEQEKARQDQPRRHDRRRRQRPRRLHRDHERGDRPDRRRTGHARPAHRDALHRPCRVLQRRGRRFPEGGGASVRFPAGRRPEGAVARGTRISLPGRRKRSSSASRTCASASIR
ncbi:hypothetical protein QW131_13565 [Roseibium salinum]|nr:hypothetical protein [Roseibium salinum]